jgi:hypothetical protein
MHFPSLLEHRSIWDKGKKMDEEKIGGKTGRKMGKKKNRREHGKKNGKEEK